MATRPTIPGRSLAVVSLLAVALAGSLARAQLFGSEDERRQFTSGEAPKAAPTPAPAPDVTPQPAKRTAAPKALDAEAEKRAQAQAAEDAAKRAAEAKAQAQAAKEAQQEALRDELGQAVKQFEAEVREYRGDVQLIIERHFEQNRKRLSDQYEKGIRELEVGERQERLGAIELFERFLARYPDDERYTPDAMTRLAELYYEKSVDDQQVALAEYEERQKLGAADEPPPEAARSFEKSIALYQQLITKFPTYRLVDAIYYLLGWCLNEQGEPEQSRDTFRALIQRYPTSKYVPEAWVRIGEYYFDYSGPDVNDKLKDAILAYTEATKFKDSPFYDKALYKLGWAYYRLDDFDRGVEAFVRLIDYYDELKRAGKDSGGDLRAEALQYTAISFADDKWGGTEKNPDGSDRFLGVQKMAGFFKQKGGREYEYELFRKLGDVLFDKTMYRAAVEAYRIVLERNPWAPDAPQTQERIVQAFAREQDKASAFAERDKLVKQYGEKSEWAQKNKGDQEILRAARDLVEKSLLATAQYHHQQAVEYEKAANADETPAEQKDQKRLLAFESYKKAAAAYGTYLAEFPHSKNLYDIQYFHAETLYNSLQFLAAADEYARVRDSNTDNKYLSNSAYYVVLSLQREIEQEEAQGLLEKREPCTVEKCKAVADFKPQPIPDIRLKLIAAADIYMQKIPTAEDAPILSYKAAQTLFTYFHFDEARERYEEVIKHFGDKDVAQYAYEDIFISYLLVQDWMNVELFADRLMKESKAVQNDQKKYEETRSLKYGARFFRADQAMRAQKWEEASKLYVSIVDDTEKDSKEKGYRSYENADKALYNAATCFKESRRFDSAMRTYERLFTDYPRSSLAETSLFYVAEAAEKAFEFEKAIDRYQKLVELYPNSKDRVAALFNASQLLEALQRYPEAAKSYKRYSELFPNEPDAPDQAYQSALIYQRMHDNKGMITALQGFIAAFKNKPDQGEKIVQAYLKIGKAWKELKNEPQALQAFKDTVAEYDKRQMKPESYMAAQAASEADFWLAEKDFAVFQALKFDPKGKGNKLAENMKKDLENLAKQLDAVKAKYKNVIVKYRWPEWMTAALYRIGNGDEVFAQKLLDSPCPAEVKALGGEEACTEYRISLEEMLAPIIERYVTAYETAADKAQELRISNDWTKLTMEKVCQNSPTKCKSLKDPRQQLITDSLSPKPLSATADGATAVQYVAPQPAPQPAPAPNAQPAPEAQPVGIGAPANVQPASAPAQQPAPVPLPGEVGNKQPAANGGTP